MSVVSIGDREDWPLDLSHEVRESFRRLRAEGKIFDEQPSFMVGADTLGIYRAYAFLAITKDAGVLAETAMRAQQFEIDQADALEMLIFFEINEELRKVLEGKSKLEPLTKLMERMDAAASTIKLSREATMNSAWTTRTMFVTNRWRLG